MATHEGGMATHRVFARPSKLAGSIGSSSSSSSSSSSRKGTITPLHRARGAQYPYSSDDGDGWTTTAANTWTSGFFPGVLWNLHNLTGKAEWRAAAEKWTERIANQQRDWSLQHDYGAAAAGRGGLRCKAVRTLCSCSSARSGAAIGSP